MQFKKLEKHVDNYSTTEKIHDYLLNPDWQLGFKELKNNIPLTEQEKERTYYSLYNLISSAHEDIGNEIYERIAFYTDNLVDIDTCELMPLLSMAQLLGYDTKELHLLSYPYPKEVYKLLSLLSIKSSILFSNNSFIQRSEKLKQSLMDGISSQWIPFKTVSTIDYDEDGNEDEDTRGNLEFEDFTCYNDAEFRVELMYNAFRDVLENFSYKAKYPTLPNRPQTIEGLIYKNRRLRRKLDSTARLYSDKIDYFTTEDDDGVSNLTFSNFEIFETKIRLNIPLSFNEVLIVNAINANQDKLENYSATEQIVLQAELNRRAEIENKIDPISRFNPERERKVQEFFAFIESFNFNFLNSFDQYDLKDRDEYLHLKGLAEEEKRFIRLLQADNLSTSDSDYATSTEDINKILLQDVAKQLCDTAILISYIRDDLKILAKKYAIYGTLDIIQISIKELFLKSIYGQGKNWRLTDRKIPFLNNILPDNVFNAFIDKFERLDGANNLRIKLLEYWDSTEYFNIDKDLDYNAIGYSNYDKLSLHRRYWEPTVSVDTSVDPIEFDGDIPKDDIYAFYRRLRKNIRNEANITTYLDENGEIDDEFETFNFLGEVFNAGAVSAFHNDQYSTLIQPLSSVLNENFTRLFEHENLNAYRRNLNRIFRYGQISGIISYDDYKLEPTRGKFYYEIEQIFNREILQNPMHEQYNFARAFLSQYPDLSGSRTLTGNCVITDLGFEEDEKTKIKAVSGRLVNFDNADGDYFFDNIYLTSKIKRFEVGNVLKNKHYIKDDQVEKDIFQKYTGTEYGLMPWANNKNKIHPSYALHPYMPRFVEVLNTITYALQNVFINILKDLFYDIEYIRFNTVHNILSQRIDNNGNTINSWLSQNIEYTGYDTYYEHYKNLNDVGQVSYNIDIDGPWNPKALFKFLDDEDAFDEFNIQNNEFYQNIGLTHKDKIEISKKLYENRDRIIALKDHKITQYCVDFDDNHYMLYKNVPENDYDNYDEFGEIWVRLNNHPLALPLSAQFGNSVEYYGGEILNDIVTHAYDFGIFEEWIWITNRETDSEHDYGIIHPRVNIGSIISHKNKIEIYPEYPNNIKQLHFNSLHDDRRIYLGVTHTDSSIVLCTVQGATVNSCVLPSAPSRNARLTLHFNTFTPENIPDRKLSSGSASTVIPFNVRTAMRASNLFQRNVFRSCYNANNLLSLAFECRINNIGVITNYWNNTSTVAFRDLWVGGNQQNYDNSIATGEVVFHPEDRIFRLQNVNRSYPFCDVGCFPILSRRPSTITNLNSYNNLDDVFKDAYPSNISYNIQLFSRWTEREIAMNSLDREKGYITTNILKQDNKGIIVYYGFDMYHPYNVGRWTEHITPGRDIENVEDIKIYDYIIDEEGLDPEEKEVFYVNEMWDEDTKEAMGNALMIVENGLGWDEDPFFYIFTFFGQKYTTPTFTINGDNYKYIIEFIGVGKLNFILMKED